MKRMKALACCIAAVSLAMVLAGCSSQQAYTPPDKTPTLSTPVIGKEGTLRVGVDASKAPFAGTPSGSSKIVGIDVDVAAALADNLGLKLEVVDVGNDPDTALSEGKVDVVMGISQSNSEATFWKTTPYLPSAVALFATGSGATVPTKASAPKIAAQVSSTSSWQVTNEFGDEALDAVNSPKDAFAALDAGTVQYAAADAVIGMYVAHTEGYEVSIAALMQRPAGYCIGVGDANAELKQAVSDALVSLTGGGIVSVIEKKWLGTSIDAAALPLTEGAQAAKAGDAGETSEGGTANAATGEGASSEGGTVGEPGQNAVQP